MGTLAFQEFPFIHIVFRDFPYLAVGLVRLRLRRETDREINMKHFVADLFVIFIARSPNPLKHRVGAVAIGFRHKNAELVAAGSGQNMIFLTTTFKHVRGPDNQGVAFLMPQGVV